MGQHVEICQKADPARESTVSVRGVPPTPQAKAKSPRPSQLRPGPVEPGVNLHFCLKVVSSTKELTQAASGPNLMGLMEM